MNAPKNRQSDDRNSHIASLALVMPVACRGRRRRIVVSAGAAAGAAPGLGRRTVLGGVCSMRRHAAAPQSLGSSRARGPTRRCRTGRHDRTRDQQPEGLVNTARVARGSADRAATIEREVRRRRHVDPVAVAVIVAVGDAWPRCRRPRCVGWRLRRPTRRRRPRRDGSRTSRPSASSVYLRCQKSSRASTSGISAKLYSGGGDGIDHSSDAAVPRVVRRRPRPARRLTDHVDEEDQHRQGDDERADRLDRFSVSQPMPDRVAVGAARHAR